MGYASDSVFVLRVPAAAAVNVALRTIALSDAESMIEETAFGDKCERAHVMLAAHYLALLPGSGMTAGESGIVSAQSAGEISVSYAVPDLTGVDPLLATTLYGRAFLQMRASVLHSPENG